MISSYTVKMPTLHFIRDRKDQGFTTIGTTFSPKPASLDNFQVDVYIQV